MIVRIAGTFMLAVRIIVNLPIRVQYRVCALEIKSFGYGIISFKKKKIPFDILKGIYSIYFI